MKTGGTIMRAVAAIGGLALVAAGLTGAASAGATVAASSTGVRAPGGIVPVVLDPSHSAPTTVGPTTPNGALHASSGGGATFVVNYDAGFNANPQAKAAFQFAVDQWAQNISSPVPITIDASFGDLGDPSILGGAGPTNLYRDFSGAPMANTWYPVALANALHGSDIDAATSDISATFSSTFPNFYFGTDGNTGGKVDFASVVMHELGHGLGFLGIMSVSSGSGSCCFGGFPSIYDRFTTSNGTSLLSVATGAPLAAALQGQTVRFTGAKATAANGGTSPRLYAPASWQSGSSYSHLDESTFPAGDPNSLMTPAIGANEVIHSPGPIVLGIFSDTGWTIGAPTLGIGDARVVEGNSASRSLRFSVALSKPASHSVSVHYSTSPRTALAGTDYVATTGTLTIPAGARSRLITVAVLGDRTVEANERFKVALSAPVGANIAPGGGNGYIENDDTSSGAQISIGDASVVEGDLGDRTVSLPITLSVPFLKATAVQWSSASGTALAGVDFENASGTATFAPGITTAYVSFTVHADTAVEGTESFAVTLSNSTRGTIRRPTGTATIADDD